MESKRKTDRKSRKLQKAQAFLALVKSNRESLGQEKDQTTGAEETMDVEVEQTPLPLLTNSNKHAGEKISDSAEPCEKKKMSTDAFNEMKKILRERNKMAMQRPKVFLTPNEILPFKSTSDECDNVIPPLYTIDLQHLLLYAIQGNTSSFKPRWCKLLRVTKISSVVVIFLDGVSYSDFVDDKESFKFIDKSFNSHVEMVCPEQYNCSVDTEIHSVPLSISQIKKANVKVHDNVKKEVAAKLKHSGKKSSDHADCSISRSKDIVSRVCLLLSSNQMKMEGYPMPVETKDDQYKDFVFSKDHYTDVTSDSPLFAVDCEMCQTTIRKNELTRVSVIDESGNTIYDNLVKPRNKIINYLTKFSGITKKMLDPVDMRLEDVQRDLKELLPPDAILCGQSLNFDLLALKMFHPYVIDTSVIFNMSGNKGIKAGLKKLTGFFLNRSIQDSKDGHCSVEDARATLDLVKLKLKRGLEFGDATINGVYFPNVQTYFLGSKDGTKGSIENVEQESSNKSHSSHGQASPESLKRPQPADSNHLDSKRLKTLHEVNPENNSWTSSKQRISMFHQNNSVHVCQSFFKLVDEAGRTGCMIGRESLTSKYEKDPIEKCTVSSDKEVCKSAKQAVQSKEFTWVDFQKFRQAMSDPEVSKEYLESVKRKLDRRVEKVMANVKEKSLVVVMMTGREGIITNAGTFIKIT